MGDKNLFKKVSSIFFDEIEEEIEEEPITQKIVVKEIQEVEIPTVKESGIFQTIGPKAKEDYQSEITITKEEKNVKLDSSFTGVISPIYGMVSDPPEQPIIKQQKITPIKKHGLLNTVFSPIFIDQDEVMNNLKKTKIQKVEKIEDAVIEEVKSAEPISAPIDRPFGNIPVVENVRKTTETFVKDIVREVDNSQPQLVDVPIVEHKNVLSRRNKIKEERKNNLKDVSLFEDLDNGFQTQEFNKIEDDFGEQETYVKLGLFDYED